ncbi:MAG: fibronectin type III domain-containing protein [Imperialibacter sp.]|uniref:fibronectin type III domain-containing protein n=1 Tax=Imperialibacter sp. TaxID=2038411 RepID=UPI0032EDE7B7
MSSEPASQPTDLIFDNVATNNVELKFTAPTLTPAGYIILRKVGSSPTETPVDGVTYTVGNSLGGSLIVSIGAGARFFDTNLTAGTKYFYSIFSFNGSAGSYNYVNANPLQGSQIMLPSAPVLDPVSLLTQTGFTLSWSAVNGATDYRLFLSSDNFVNTLAGYDGKLTGLVASRTLEGLSSGTSYHIKILAVNEAGNSSISNTESAITIPASPVATAASMVAQTSFVANWESVIGANDYYLTVSANANLSSPLADFDGATPIDGSIFSKELSGLDAGTAYYFAVSAGNATGKSPLSNVQSQLLLPAAPMAISASLVGQTSFSANWDKVNGSNNYYLEVSVNSDLSSPIDEFDGSAPISSDHTSQQLTDLAPGTAYFYRVSAENSTGRSGTSNVISQVTIPSEPMALGVTSTDITATSFVAMWEPAIGATEYELEASANDFVTSLAGFNPFTLSGTELQVTGLLPQTAYQFRVRAKNAAGKSGNSNIVTVTTKSEASASPLSVNIVDFVNKLMEGSSQTLSIAVAGGTPPYILGIDYRGVLEAEFNTATPDEKGNNRYQFTITSDMMDEMGIVFRITVLDANNEEVSKMETISLAFEESQSPAIPFERFGGKSSTWNIFAIPYELDNKSISTIFADLDQSRHEFDWRIVRYRSSSDDYVNYNTGQVKLGEAYWFNAKKAISINVGAGQTTASVPFNLPLSKGWNLIGNPYTKSISWNNVLADNGSPDDIGTLKIYNGSSFVVADQLNPFSGGFVFADAATSVSIDPLSPSFSGRILEGMKEQLGSDIDDISWATSLTLRDGQTLEILGGFGMHPDADNIKDKFDGMAVPRFFDYTELFVTHDGYFYPKFATDVVPTKGDHTWSFTLSSNKVVGSTNLTWDMEALQNKASSLYLLDQQSGKLVDMKTTDSHTVDLSKGDFKFEVYFVGSGNQVVPSQLLLGDAYPNPASTQATIPVLLPGDANELVDIDLSVFDINGNRISTLASGKYKPGVYEFTWNAGVEQNRSVSGMFFYRLSFNDNNRAPLYKKLILR